MITRDPKHVLIGLPLRNGDTRFETTLSLLRLCTEKNPLGISISIYPYGGGDVAHARNMILHYAMTKTDAGKLVFIDSDIVFTSRDFLRLCAWLLTGCGIVCGLYPRKRLLELSWSINLGSKPSDLFPELHETPEVCGGFLGIDLVTVAQPLLDAHPETEYVIEDSAAYGEIGHELFAMGVVNRRRLTEDYFFSQRATALGYRLFVDPTIQLGHVGDADYLDVHQGKPSVLPRQT